MPQRYNLYLKMQKYVIFYISKCKFWSIFYSLKYKHTSTQKDRAGKLYFCSRNQQENQHNPSMKNNNTIFVRMSIISTIIMTVALMGVGMTEDMTVRFVISGTTAVLVWGTYLALSMKQKQDFSNQAMAVLTKAGVN